MDDSQKAQSYFVHAFNSPLTAMRGAIDLLRQPRRMPDDPITRELIETLERSVARLRLVTEALLAHSRASGDIVEVVAPLSLFMPPTGRPAATPPPEAETPRPETPAPPAQPHTQERAENGCL